VRDVLLAASQRLQTAQFGLEDMKRPERAQSGLYNAVVFGRMVTFALQNLRHKAPGFDPWYNAKQEQMRSDPLLRFFHDLRTQIEKQTRQHTAPGFHIRSFGPDEFERLKPAPPNAVSFFMGDMTGGSGWEIRTADGTIQKYYVNLPADIGGPR
jgi:hypothetical protein